MIICDVPQGSAEWHKLRAGVLTASRIERLLTPTLRLSAQRRGLMCELLAERIKGGPVNAFLGNVWTERGNMLESEASALFEMITGKTPKSAGFIYKNEDRRCGCSPDWLMDDAGAEFKCPGEGRHVELMLADGNIPSSSYFPQVQFSMWVTGLDKWYLMSYAPDFPPVIMEVLSEECWQTAFDECVPMFLSDMDYAWRELLGKGVRYEAEEN